MRICRKCQKQFSGPSKICRECGAILEEMPDAESAAVQEPQESPPPSSSRSADPNASQSESDAGTSLGRAAVNAGGTTRWKCSHCGESIPATFDVCWNCLTSREGVKASEEELASFRRAVETEVEHRQTPRAASPAETSPMDDVEEDDANETGEDLPKPPCVRCGSAKIMRGITVSDQGEHSDGQLKVVVFGSPDAILFKDRLYGKLRADICGECGHVEFRVTNPRQLYRHWLKAPNQPPY